MSKYLTNPVGSLQEKYQSRGLIPQYKIVRAEGASHSPTFSFQVILGNLASTGSGSSKKQAKDAAARAMLAKLDGRVEGLLPQAGVADEPPAGGVHDNTVGRLQELCVRHGYPMPTYGLGVVGGQAHQRSFSVLCRAGRLEERGEGGSKRDAKREAAEKMMNRLQCLGLITLADTETDRDQLQVQGEELSTFKVETLNSRDNKEVVSLDKKLQTAGGSKLTSLGRMRDYVAMLVEMGKEHKFEVTCVDRLEENCARCADSSQQWLLQLSTAPVLVSYEFGTDSKTAHNEAARSALNYLKIMTRK
eukprot:GFUD01041164.1.p1 GENE.GFUD01041164.1~~GFUD01041164.1.p1  ORF type:complete len:304 (+),score=103.88 GFUD01041164.1:61-972(+)